MIFALIKKMIPARKVQKETVRRWDAAKTDRLNAAHWANTTGRNINDDLTDKWETLAIRSAHESQNNAFVAGIINTYCDDLVGPDGPTLQVHTKDKKFANAVESAWRDFWADPDIAGQLAGPQMLRLWAWSLWINGEFLSELSAGNEGDRLGPRVNAIDPRRLKTPVGAGLDSVIVLGVERDRVGRPLKYHIQDSLDGSTVTPSIETRDVPPGDIIHGFKMLEPGQARGIPWLAPVLQVIADIRDYDIQVMDAARAAADQCIVMHADHPDAKFVEIDEDTTLEIERRTMRFLPPGWKADQMDPRQPSTQYKEYRAERLREIGRPVGMPLMMVMLDSSGHNYSSARFDGQLYRRGIECDRAWLARIGLDRFVEIIVQQGRIASKIPKPPDDVRYQWIWPAFPHVDPSKEAKADDIKLKNLTLSLSAALSASGIDFETHVAQLKREKEALYKAGIVADSPGNNGISTEDIDEAVVNALEDAKK